MITHAFTSGKADGGDATQVQPSNWNADHIIDNDGLVFPANTPAPGAPVTGMRLYGSKNAGRPMATVAAAEYPATELQPFLGSTRGAWYVPSGNSATLPVINGISFTTFVGTATARDVATTNALTRMRRIGIVSANPAGSLVHFRQGSGTTGIAQFTTGNGAAYPLGGFHCIIRFAQSDASTQAGARMFVGLHSSTSAPTNVQPSTLTNCVGIAQLSTDANQLYLVYGGSSAQTAEALGATNFPVSSSVPFELALFSSPADNGTIYWELTNLATGVSTGGYLPGGAAICPVSTTLLGVHCWRTNNANTGAVGLDIAAIYIETKL